jgi:TPR repeat protein
MRSKNIIIAAVTTALFVVLAPRVEGYFQSYIMFSPSQKYGEWFHAPLTHSYFAQRAQSGLQAPTTGVPEAEKYPYPEKSFELTEDAWRDSTGAVEGGKPNWYDVEIVRQRAEVEEYAPAMDFLAWMYEKGQGLQQDQRKAFMWYERAKLMGEEQLRGDPARIYQRLSPQDKYFAQLQLSEDIERLKSQPKSTYQAYDSVKLHVLEQQREYFLENPKPEKSNGSPFFVVR